MKILGADIVAFFDEPWPDGYYVDDSNKTVVDGKIFADDDDLLKNPLPLDKKYELSDFGEQQNEGGPSLTAMFGKWKKSQTTVTLVVEVPMELEQEVRDKLAITGVKVR
jgi:hypothetical protein